MNTLVTITQGANLIGAFAPIAIGIALQIKKLLTAGDSGAAFDVQIQAYQDGILKTLDETDQIIADWKAAHPE